MPSEMSIVSSAAKPSGCIFLPPNNSSHLQTWDGDVVCVGTWSVRYGVLRLSRVLIECCTARRSDYYRWLLRQR